MATTLFPSPPPLPLPFLSSAQAVAASHWGRWYPTTSPPVGVDGAPPHPLPSPTSLRRRPSQASTGDGGIPPPHPRWESTVRRPPPPQLFRRRWVRGSNAENLVFSNEVLSEVTIYSCPTGGRWRSPGAGRGRGTVPSQGAGLHRRAWGIPCRGGESPTLGEIPRHP